MFAFPYRLVAVSVVFMLAFSSAAVSQITVSPDDLQGWLIGPFGTPPPAGFETGPDMPPAGGGSYGTEITVAASKQILLRNDLHNVPLSELSALSFWTFIDVGATNVNNWYINLYFDTDGDGTYDGVRLDYVPPSGSVAAGVWQQWDAMAGTWNVNTGGTTTLAAFLSSNPDARFNAFSTPDGGALRFNMGDTASNYVGFDGNLDLVRVAVDSLGDREWDFELMGPSVLEIPTADTYGLLALGLLLGLLAIWRLRVS